MNTTVTVDSAQLPADTRRVSADSPVSASWGIVTTSLLGAASFGILPALIWPGAFRESVESEVERLNAAGEWAAGIEASPGLSDGVRRINAVHSNAFLPLVPRLLALFAAVVLGMQFLSQPFTLDRLTQYTYGFTQHAADLVLEQSDGNYFNHLQIIHSLWIAALCGAYGAHWLQVQRYRRAVRQFVKQFNRVIGHHDMLPVRARIEGRFRPLLIIAAIAFCQYGAWWSIPMLLAASAQSRYTLVSSHAMAVQFADRMSKRPMQRSAERRCDGQGCRALLPRPAKFCPQCGRRVPTPLLDRMG